MPLNSLLAPPPATATAAAAAAGVAALADEAFARLPLEGFLKAELFGADLRGGAFIDLPAELGRLTDLGFDAFGREAFALDACGRFALPALCRPRSAATLALPLPPAAVSNAVLSSAGLPCAARFWSEACSLARASLPDAPRDRDRPATAPAAPAAAPAAMPAPAPPGSSRSRAAGRVGLVAGAGGDPLAGVGLTLGVSSPGAGAVYV